MIPSAAHQQESPATESGAPGESRRQREEALVRLNFGFVWRVARRFGLASADAEDVAQRVLLTAAKRLTDLIPGKERAFLFRATSYEVSRMRRSQRRRSEETLDDLERDPEEGADPEQLLEQRRARTQLDRILNRMSETLREVFVLYELEGFAVREIADAVGISEGTVASRLRRAREQFTRFAAREGVLRLPMGGK